MKGLVYIMAAYALGEALSMAMHRFMPASILGMVFLFLALRLKTVGKEDVQAAAQPILRHMMLFFVPVSVGIMATYEIVGAHLWAIVVSVIVSTAVVIVAVGWTHQWLGKRIGRKP